MNKNRACIAAFLCACLTLTGCGGSSGGDNKLAPPGGGGAPMPEAVTVPLGTAVKNVLIEPDTAVQFSFTYTVPDGVFSAPYTSYGGFAMKLADTMSYVRLTSAPVANNGEVSIFDPWRVVQWILTSDIFGRLIGIERALAAVNATVTAFVSYPGDPDVCNTGVRIGPYTFAGEVDDAWTSDSDSDSVSGVPPRIHVVKSGTFEVCIAISPLSIPMDAYLTVDAFEAEAAPCEESPPADDTVLGSWSGKYTCTNFGTGNDEDLDITLTISKNQDGTYTYTDDGGATYNGHFCGTKFRFRGGVADDYTETGTFWLTGAGMAMKESHWNGIPAGFSGGDCVDMLTKD